MLEVNSEYGIRYLNPWNIMFIEPIEGGICRVKMPAAGDSFYSMRVHEPAAELAERCVRAMRRPFYTPAGRVTMELPWVSTPKNRADS